MNCPACGTAMTEVTVANVKVDACQGGCGGIWFDQFELAKVLDADRAKAEKARRVAHVFRFICPSYYIPGKQAWGAF